MKQDLHNNNPFKQAFNDRELSPSINSWDKLAGLLDEQMPVNNVNSSVVKAEIKYKIYFIAAAMICILSLSFWVLNSEKEIDDNTNIVQTDVSIIDLIDKNEILEAEIKNGTMPFVIEEKKSKIATDKNGIAVKSIDNNEVVKQASFIKVTEPINKGEKQIQIAWEPSKTKNIEINTQNLLRNVERELIKDHAESELSKPKDKLEQIRLAIINRNLQE